MNKTLLNSLTLDDVSPESNEMTTLMRTLSQALKQIRFGTIEIIVQDGRVAQINRTEKIRF